MFVDEVKITVESGRGGDGIVSFRREKYIPRGGPDGGDGGRGGHVILAVDRNLNTLQEFRFKRVFKAEAGKPGAGSGKSGRQAEDLIIPVPAGTLVKDQAGNVLADLVEPGDKYMAARGGRGGRGNIHFATATRHVPDFAEHGEPNEERFLTLELKLLADVGLVGYPNAGKSTLLSRLSAARPKIADYPFTTLEPNLGVVGYDGDGFVMADIPGLVEGAHRGVGLGIDFLKHIERTRILLFVIDCTGFEGRNPHDDFGQLLYELKMFNPILAERRTIIAANKIDVPEGAEGARELARALEPEGYEVLAISAVTGEGLGPLVARLTELIKSTPRPEGPQIATFQETPQSLSDFTIEATDGVYVVHGRPIERLVSMSTLNSDDALRRLQRALKHAGLEERLIEAGAAEGDAVRIGKTEFEFRIEQ